VEEDKEGRAEGKRRDGRALEGWRGMLSNLLAVIRTVSMMKSPRPLKSAVLRYGGDLQPLESL